MTILGINRNLFLTIIISLVFHLGVIFGVMPNFATQAGQTGEIRLIVSFGSIEMPVIEPQESIPQTEESLSPPDKDSFTTTPEPLPKEPQPELTPDNLIPGTLELTAGEIEDIKTKYLRKVASQIQRAKRYPAFAKRRSIEDSVKVEFIIMDNGEVSSVKMLTASRYKILDKEALAMIKRAGPFPPMPEELNTPEMKLSLWITFRLKK